MGSAAAKPLRTAGLARERGLGEHGGARVQPGHRFERFALTPASPTTVLIPLR